MDRLETLRRDVAGLPVDPDYKAAMLCSIERYADQILARPIYAQDEGLDDLEAIQQVTLSNMVEASLQALLRSE